MAIEWMVINGRTADTLLPWDVEAQGWPDGSITDKVLRAVPPACFMAVPWTRETLATALRQKFDPHEVQAWAFAPGFGSGDDEEVWLVRVPRVILN